MNFKNKIRNVYQHVDINEASKDLYFKGNKIHLPENLTLDDLKKQLGEAREGKKGLPSLFGYKDSRVIGELVKQKKDKLIALSQFIELDKVFRQLVEEYLL